MVAWWSGYCKSQPLPGKLRRPLWGQPLNCPFSTSVNITLQGIKSWLPDSPPSSSGPRVQTRIKVAFFFKHKHARQFYSSKGEVKDRVFLPINEGIFIEPIHTQDMKETKLSFTSATWPHQACGKKGKIQCHSRQIPCMGWKGRKLGCSNVQVPKEQYLPLMAEGETAVPLTGFFSTTNQWVRNFVEDIVRMASGRSVISRTTTEGESRTGAQNHHEVSSFTGLVVDAGCQQRPQLNCRQKYPHMLFPCCFSVQLTLGFPIA